VAPAAGFCSKAAGRPSCVAGPFATTNRSGRTSTKHNPPQHKA